MSMAKVGKPAPAFSLNCVRAADARPRNAELKDYAGRWLVLVFYPRDFSFVCPTELTAFSAHLPEFETRDCSLLGISVDPIELHRQWLATPLDQGGLGPLRFPLASDPDGRVARDFGVWVEEKAISTRGLFIIDPHGTLQYSVIHNLSVGRRPDVILRVLDALQTGGLCPANWTSADGTIDPERALQPGRVLGHYRIVKRLGAGTFGSVFAAWDLRLERTVALKVLRRDVFESREAILAEARTAARLSHPHLCTIYAVEEEDGLPVIAMEYVDGQPLSEVIRAGLDPEAAWRLAVQIASGLALAHAENVVHGDLKPANIMVTKEGVAKILDFGLASSQLPAELLQVPATADQSRHSAEDLETAGGIEATMDFADSAPSAARPKRGTAIRGTPAYMSPEQAAGMPATPASDVFSFGLTLYEMLTGSPFHPEVPIIELLLRLRNWEVEAEWAALVEESYRRTLISLLSRDQTARPAMAEIARELAARVLPDSAISGDLRLRTSPGADL